MKTGFDQALPCPLHLDSLSHGWRLEPQVTPTSRCPQWQKRKFVADSSGRLRRRHEIDAQPGCRYLGLDILARAQALDTTILEEVTEPALQALAA
jgi:hypothetical protein